MEENLQEWSDTMMQGYKDNQFTIIQFSIACIAANNSTFNILALASGKANHKTPNWHCRAKIFRANECRAKLV